MKKLIIASAILSSSAMAAVEPLNFKFTLDSGSAQSCVLNSGGDAEATIGVIGEDFSSNNMTVAKLTSNLVNNVKFEAYGGWSDVSAWKGEEPNTFMQVETSNKFEYQRKEYSNENNFTHNLPANGSLEIENLIAVSFAADRPTSVGRGEYNLMVHIECE